MTALSTDRWALLLLMASIVVTTTGAATAQEQEPFRWPRADSIEVELTSRVEVTGGDVAYRYAIRSLPSSRQRVEAFGIEVPREGVGLVRSPDGWDGFFPWEVADWQRLFPDKTGIRVLLWGALGKRDRLDPGHRRSGFEFRSDLLPAQGRFWARGFVFDQVPTFDLGAAPAEVEDESLYENSVSGPTLVPRIPPSEADEPGEIANRMAELLDLSCGDGWIDNRGICHSLRQKLRQARRSLDRGRTSAARNQLGTFRNQLEAQRGKHVDERAFSVLELYADRLEARL